MLVKARRGETGLMPELAALLEQSDENWDADILIARALGLIPGEASLNMLVALVNREDPDEDTCQEAIRSLAKKEGTVARDAIKSLLDFDDENVQAAAAAALLKYGDPDAKKLIDQHFADPEASDWDEDVLAMALGIEGNAAALPYLFRLAANEFWDTRQLAVRALGATRVPEARKALLDAMADDDEDVAVTAAATLLREFGDETGVDLLVKTIETTKDVELITDAIRALAELGRPEHAELFRKQFEVEAEKVQQLLGKLWAAYAVLKTTK
jgi:HEAT repeat protein